MEKYILLRDDDTNFYTNIEDLEQGYGEIWGMLPITLAVIPFVHGSESKIMDYDMCIDKFQRLRNWELTADSVELAKYNELQPIGNNEKLVKALALQVNNGKIEIAQHGVQHKYDEKGAEMMMHKISYEDIRAGKEYLQKVFMCDINTFIPPSNTIDEYCAKAVSSLELNIICSSTIKYATDYRRYISYLLDPEYSIEKIIRKIINCKPPIHRRKGIGIASTHTFGINVSKDYMFDMVKMELDKYGFSGVGTHYRLFSNDGYRKAYHSLIDRLMCLANVTFLTAKDYYQKLWGKYYE